MNEVLTIEQAEYSGGYTLVLLFSNGEKREFDFASLLDKGVCRKLRDMDYFRNFKIICIFSAICLVIPFFIVILQAKHQEQSPLGGLANRVWTTTVAKVRCGRILMLNFKKSPIMNKNISSDFAARFAAMSTSSLVESFNAQVGNPGFNSARASHDIALIDELTARGIDVSAIYNNGRISFAKKVVLDKESTRLIIQE